MASYYRKNKNYNCSEYKEEYDKVNGNRYENPEEYVEDIENKRLTLTILSRMSEEYRMALVLYEIEQLSYKDIAQRLNWSIAKVKVTIYRARIKFRQLYGKVDYSGL